LCASAKLFIPPPPPGALDGGHSGCAGSPDRNGGGVADVNDGSGHLCYHLPHTHHPHCPPTTTTYRILLHHHTTTRHHPTPTTPPHTPPPLPPHPTPHTPTTLGTRLYCARPPHSRPYHHLRIKICSQRGWRNSYPTGAIYHMFAPATAEPHWCPHAALQARRRHTCKLRDCTWQTIPRYCSSNVACPIPVAVWDCSGQYAALTCTYARVGSRLTRTAWFGWQLFNDTGVWNAVNVVALVTTISGFCVHLPHTVACLLVQACAGHGTLDAARGARLAWFASRC